MIKNNEYYDGKVKSLGNNLKGQTFTIGIIEAGEFTFGTETEELMEIILGEMTVIHPDGNKKNYKKGESFIVPMKKQFTVLTQSPVSYLCLYK